jgi:hypothetical protein
MRLRVVVLVARLLLQLLLLLLLLLLLQLPGSVRLGGTTHSSNIAGIVGLCCGLPCLALLHCYKLGLLLAFEQQRDRSGGVDASLSLDGRREKGERSLTDSLYLHLDLHADAPSFLTTLDLHAEANIVSELSH